jgi:hypothetical protein
MDFQLHALSLKLGRVKEMAQNSVDANVATNKLDDVKKEGIFTCFIFPILFY